MELIALFNLVHFDESLILAACEQLVESKSFSAAIKLCSVFQSLAWPFEEMVRSMAQCKDWTSAELLVRSTSHLSKLSTLYKGIIR